MFLFKVLVDDILVLRHGDSKIGYKAQPRKMHADYFVIRTRFVILACIFIKLMGRGDKKSKKGKRTMGSFGVSRSKTKIKARLKRVASKKKSSTTAAAAAKPKRSPRKKAEA